MNELTPEQLKKAIEMEMKTFDLITRIVKKSFEEERLKKSTTKIVKTANTYYKFRKKSAA